MLLDIDQQFNQLKISKVSKNNTLEFLEIILPKNELYEWSLEPSGKNTKPDYLYTHWYANESVYRKYSSNLNKFRIQEIIMNLDEEARNKIYEFNRPSILFCDIETEVIDGFPSSKDPKEKVTVIGFYDDKEGVAKVYGIKKMSQKEIQYVQDSLNVHLKDFFPGGVPFQYTYFSSEFDMLYHAFANDIKNSLVFTGWNFLNFDWPYLVQRARRIGLQPEICAEDLSFTFREETPKHKLIVDALEVFKKWGGAALGQVENKSLDEVSNVLLGVQKVKHPETLQWLFENDFPRYVFYNIVDTILVHLIDKKIGLFLTMFKLAQLGQIETRRVFSPVHFTEMGLCRFLHSQNRILIPGHNAFEIENQKTEKIHGTDIEGGFVKSPEKGLWSTVAACDFASLYPTIMRAFNISVESYIGFEVNLSKEILSKKDDIILNAFGTVFKRDKGVMVKWLDKLYADRKSKQGQLKILKQNLVKIESELQKRRI